MGSLKENRRLLFFIILLGGIFILIIGKLVQLMILTPHSESPNSITLPVVERGPILDRNGKILAISTRLKSVSAWIPDLNDPEGTADLLADILDIRSKEDILLKFQNNSGFVYIKRKITPTESEKLKAIQKDGRLTGINLIPEFGRNYPEQKLACHVLGYVGVDNFGLDGIEYTFNNVLSPPAVGQDLNEVFGNQVFLTLDINIQYIIEKIAEEAYEKNKADSVYILVMDARNGEILGYCAIPGFDPNEYNRFDKNALQNLPLIRAYEPGSVFKIISIASMLELGAIHSHDYFFCNGFYEKKLPDGRVIKIRDLGSHGRVNAQLILKYSCNAGAAYASDRVDASSFYRMLLRFGFGKPTGLPLPGESAGILAEPRHWSSRTKATIAFGQEISVSALQILSAANVLANNGILLKPRIVKKIISPQGKLIKEFPREPISEVLSPDTARSVLEMMETAVQEGGTARRGRIDGIRISAKTGTAQVPDKDTGKYSETDFIASYLGIFPTDDPRLIIYVVINHPRGKQIYGSQIAAPVFRESADRLITYTGIHREGDPIIRHTGEVRIKLPEEITIGSLMPDLTGMPKRLLLPLFKQGRFKVLISGNGYVVNQTPSPGTLLKQGMTVRLELE